MSHNDPPTSLIETVAAITPTKRKRCEPDIPFVSLRLCSECVTSNPLTPLRATVSAPLFTIGRCQSNSLRLISSKYPLAVSRQHATLKHICGMSNPVCPIHQTSCLHSQPFEKDCPYKMDEYIQILSDNVNDSERLSICSPGKFVLLQLKTHENYEKLITVCGGGWIIFDGNSIGTKPSLGGIRVNGVLLDKVTIGAQSFPGFAWLANEDILEFGVPLHPPELRYVFIRDFNRDCLYLKTKHKKTNQSCSTNVCLEVEQNPFLCSICVDWLVHPVALVCGHTFCFHCILKWFRSSKFYCPICRSLSRFPFTRVFAIDAMIEKQIPEYERSEYIIRLKESDALLEKDKKDLEFLRQQVEFYKSVSYQQNVPKYLNIKVELINKRFSGPLVKRPEAEISRPVGKIFWTGAAYCHHKKFKHKGITQTKYRTPPSFNLFFILRVSHTALIKVITKEGP